MITALQDHPVVLALGWMLVHSLWQAALIALLVRILWLFLSRKYAALRYRGALLGMLLILTLAGFTFGYYLDYYTFSDPVSIAAMDYPVQAESPAAYESLPPPAAYEEIIHPEMPAPEITASPISWEDYIPYLVFLWGLGAFLLSLRLAGSWWYMRRVSRKGLIVPEEVWSARFQLMMHRMGMRRNIRIYFSRLVDEPLTFGHLKPMILFPIGLVNKLSIDQVEAILLHELAHVYRWDYLVNWLQSVLELLFFYHPAIWWLSAEVRKAREHCCDDLVLRRGKTSRKLYAQTLTQLAVLSFKPKTKLVMSIKGIKDAFSQRVLRLYGQDQAVLDWRKPVLSLALGCMLFPLLWLIQPVVSAGDSEWEMEPEMSLEKGGPEIDEEDLFTASVHPVSVAKVPPTVHYPLPEGDEDLAPSTFYDQLQLETIEDPTGAYSSWRPLSELSEYGVSPSVQQSGPLAVDGLLEPTIFSTNEPEFIVDGQKIPAGAPYRRIKREDIAKFIWRKVPYAPELNKKLLPNERNGVIEIITKTGDWPGGRPYLPVQIRDLEVKYGEHLKSWFPVGKARSRKEMGDQEDMAFVPGWDAILRRVRTSGKETYSILNGSVLKKGETVEVNRYVIFGNRQIPAIGLYDQDGNLIYGEPTPADIKDRTLKLPFKEGHYAVIGKYPCDNRIYLTAYTTVDQHPLDYYLHMTLREGFEDVTARKALRFCKDQAETNFTSDRFEDIVPTFIVDGRPIPENAGINRVEPAEVVKREFLTPDLKRAPMLIDKGIMRMATKSGKWEGGRPYWPYEIKGREINKLGQTIYTTLNGHFLKDEETKVINAYEVTFIMGLHLVGVYDQQGQLVLGEPTPPALEQDTYRVQLQNGYTVVAPKYPCDANLSLGLVFTMDGLKAQGDIWQQTQAIEKITVQMIEEHCGQRDEIKERRTVYKPLTPEPLFVIDGQVIDPAEPYREIPNDELTTERTLQPAEAVARYGRQARNGAILLKTKSGKAKWAGGKPYSPIYKLLGKGKENEEVKTFTGTDYYFINGQVVRMSDFNRHNVYSFSPGTIMHPRVGAIFGLEGNPVDLKAIREAVGQEGIAYELKKGLVVVEYLETCRNTISIVALLSSRNLHAYYVPQERQQLRKAISWEENEMKCAGISPEAITEMTEKNLRFLALQLKLKNSLKIFPSPFTQEARIAFHLPEDLETKVSILSPEGKLIRHLVDEKLQSGAHEFIWNARGQSAGNYWVRIEAGEVQLTQPLLKQ